MSCEEFELAVHEVESQRAPAPPGYDGHARECAACAAYVERQREVSHALAMLSADLGEGAGEITEGRLRQTFLSRPGLPAPASRFTPRLWAAAAAVVIIALLSIYYRRQPTPDTVRQPIVFYALPGMPLDRDPGAKVMRVRVPRSELQRWGMSVSGRGEVVEAEVLVGIDGLPRGVRVDQVIEQ